MLGLVAGSNVNVGQGQQLHEGVPLAASRAGQGVEDEIVADVARLAVV